MHPHRLLPSRVAAGAVCDVGVHHLGERMLSADIFRSMAVRAGVGLEISSCGVTGNAGNCPQPPMIEGEGMLKGLALPGLGRMA